MPISSGLNRDFEAIGIRVDVRGSPEQRVPCPLCAKARLAKARLDRALGVNIMTGAFHCFRCNWSGCAGNESTGPRRPIIRIDDPAIARRKRERLRRTMQESVALSDPKGQPVCAYLESRALGEILRRPPTVLRAHPGLTYWDGSRDLGRYPAMLALFYGRSGQAVTVHVTYLRRDGSAKAGVPSPKKMLGVPVPGATRGGAIHLFEPRDGTLGIDEGIESALSMHILHRLPVWAAFCADNLARVHLPLKLRELHIGMDIDVSGKGQQVAQALAARVRKCSPPTKVLIVKPDVDGHGDLNDQLRRRRAANASTQAQPL